MTAPLVAACGAKRNGMGAMSESRDLKIVSVGGDGENCMTLSWVGRFNGPYPGFGTVMFWIDAETNELRCNNEFMSEEFTHTLIDLLKTAKIER